MAIKIVLADVQGEELAQARLFFHAVDDVDGAVVAKLSVSGTDPDSIQGRVRDWAQAIQPSKTRWVEEVRKKVGQEIDLSKPLL